MKDTRTQFREHLQLTNDRILGVLNENNLKNEARFKMIIRKIGAGLGAGKKSRFDIEDSPEKDEEEKKT